MARLSSKERKSLGLVLTKADQAEAEAIFSEIRRQGGSVERWERAARTPAMYAYVSRLLGMGSPTPADALEQFYRHGEGGTKCGGKVWKRPATGPWSKARNLPYYNAKRPPAKGLMA